MSATQASERIGGWLLQGQRFNKAWLAETIAHIERASYEAEAFHPVILEFQKLIEEDVQIFKGFHEMFEQVPSTATYQNDPRGTPQARDYILMLRLFNEIISKAPDYEENAFVAFPINAILTWPMATPAGLTIFLNPKVNAQFKKMFDVWASFLSSPTSRNVLTTEENGWFGPAASRAMPNFAQTFVCEPSAQFHGFNSWDDFFIRVFRPGMRPVEHPDDDSVVNSACESTVYRIAHNIKARDNFWLKGQPYSLEHIFNNDDLTPQFVGGAIYQAYLDALSYHRWHSPVNGKVVKTVMIPGTYYAQSPAMGFENPDGPDAVAACGSQAFLAAVAARALIFIQADNPNISLMCFVAVGMAEVSTCEVTVKKGDVVKKGDQIGMFHFGGSTHCLVFRPETRITFIRGFGKDATVPVNAAIATVAASDSRFAW